MGAAISNNVSNQIIDTSVQIANSYVDKCAATFSQTFNLSASMCTQNIDKIVLDQSQIVNVACIQNTTTQSSMKSDIKAQILQQTIAAAQSLGLPSLTDAQSAEDFAEKTSEDISTAVTQQCTSELNQAQNISCSAGANQKIGVIDIKGSQTTFSNCVSNSSNISQAKLDLANYISNTTNATEANSAVTFVIVALIILTFVGIFFLYTLDGPIGWVIVGIFLLIVLGIIVYATVAFTDKLYPFNQRTSVD